MIRLLTCILVLVLVACGGSDNAPTPPTQSALMSLWPVDSVNAGTKYTYAVTKVRSIGGTGTKNRNRVVETARTAGTPNTNFVGPEGAPMSQGAAFEWTARGLELSTSLGLGGLLAMAPGTWLLDGLCITAMSPNLLLLPAALTSGSTHSCTMFHNMVSAGSMTWVGPNPVSGHPAAERFTSVVSGPYMGGGGSRATATSWRVTTDWILSPGTGPVSITFTEDFLAPGDVPVDRIVYTCTLSSVTPGP